MKYFLGFLVWFLSLNATAQLAPDFQVVDSEGASHALYSDYLDNGQTVLLELFFTSCAPCLELAPLFQDFYNDWGAGSGDVVFLGLSDEDTNEQINAYKNQFGLTYAMAGTEGGAVEVYDIFTNGDFGTFYGHPAFIIIAPDGTVLFDPHEDNVEPLILVNQLLEEIVAAGTVGVVTKAKPAIELFPNPTPHQLTVRGGSIESIKILGLDGSLVFTHQAIRPNSSADIDISFLETGVYLVQIKTSESIRTERLIVE